MRYLELELNRFPWVGYRSNQLLLPWISLHTAASTGFWSSNQITQLPWLKPSTASHPSLQSVLRLALCSARSVDLLSSHSQLSFTYVSQLRTFFSQMYAWPPPAHHSIVLQTWRQHWGLPWPGHQKRGSDYSTPVFCYLLHNIYHHLNCTHFSLLFVSSSGI